MEIHGKDCVFKTTPTEEVRDKLEELFKTLWPACVLQEVSRREWHVHKDQASFDSWESEGRTNDNDDTLISVYFGTRGFTMVVAGGEDTETFDIQKAARRAFP